jgi:pimeloyl-ACP methyl ester carboxylesterase
VTTTDWTTDKKGSGKYAEVNGINLYYETIGDGRPLILLHGGLGSGEMFGPVRPALAESHQASTQIGSRTRSVIRVKSTQKFPRWSERRRAKPRITAAATAMPTAAETKFCTASPAICTRWPMVDSPE